MSEMQPWEVRNKYDELSARVGGLESTIKRQNKRIQELELTLKIERLLFFKILGVEVKDVP